MLDTISGTGVNPDSLNNYLQVPSGEYRQPERPFDSILLKTHEEVIGFLDGCGVLADLISEQEPDIVFVPLRGATPFVQTAKFIIEARSGSEDVRLPEFIDLPLGERQTIEERDEPFNGESFKIRTFGPSKKVKDSVITNTIDNLQREGTYIPGRTRLMLVDEVQSGSTIETAARSITAALAIRGDLRQLSVVAMQDSRETKEEKTGSERSKTLTGKYIAMTSESTQNQDDTVKIDATVIKLPAFTIDVHSFLDDILWLQDTEGNPESYEKIENKPASKLLKVLVNIYDNPEKALSELIELRRLELSQTIGDTIVQEMVLDNLTDPVPTRGRNVIDVQNTTNWWIGLTRKMIIKKQGDSARIN